MKFTEAKLEQAFIDLLENEGYPHFLGNTITRADDEVLIEQDLKSYLLNRYKSHANPLHKKLTLHHQITLICITPRS